MGDLLKLIWWIVIGLFRSRPSLEAKILFDRANLLGLVQDLYTTSKDNQNFLHARFGLGCDVLKPYKTIIERWLWPDVYKNQEYSVSKAKKPITGAPVRFAYRMG